MTLRSFSASVSWREGVNIVFETEDATDPVGLDLRVSWGDRQKPVTYKEIVSKLVGASKRLKSPVKEWFKMKLTSPAVLSKFSISKLLPREDCLERDSTPCCGSFDDGAGELSTSGE